MKRWESSETRFGQGSRRSEPCSGGKRPFEVSKKKFEIRELAFENVTSAIRTGLVGPVLMLRDVV